MKKNLAFNVLAKKEGDKWVAHCLELDIVAVEDTLEKAGETIADLIAAAVSYAFSNGNEANLYHPAPQEVWREYFACKNASDVAREIKPGDGPDREKFVPPWLIAKVCTDPACHV